MKKERQYLRLKRIEQRLNLRKVQFVKNLRSRENDSFFFVVTTEKKLCKVVALKVLKSCNSCNTVTEH